MVWNVVQTALFVAALVVVYWLGMSIGYSHGWDAAASKYRRQQRG